MRLLRAAEEELIQNNGHLEMLAVAKRAGLSTGLAYRYFGSKAGLVAAVVDSFYQPIRGIALGSSIPVDQPWALRERERVKALIDYYYGHPLARLIAGRLAREPQVLDVENAHMQELIKMGARNIAQGQSLGAVDPQLNPKIAVALLMGGLNQAINSAITARKRPSKRTLLENIWRLTQSALQLQNDTVRTKRKAIL
ncbi:MAG: TetR/AcrR family transcriptional regulator [Pseudomonadota bacterium]